MTSPLPAEAHSAPPVTDAPKPRPLKPRIWNNDQPHRPTRSGLATLPDVSRQKHRVAALAGVGATLLAIGGFAALIAFAPSEPTVRDAEAPLPTVTEPSADASPDAPPAVMPVSNPTAAPANPKPSSLAVQFEQASATVNAVSSVLSATSPRWGEMVGDAEEKGGTLVADDQTGELDSPIIEPADEAVVPLPTGKDDAFAAMEAPGSGDDTTEPIGEPDAATTAAIPKPDQAEGRPGRITKSVNLRTKPNDDSKVLMVVPVKANVTVLSCKSWCEVEYNGTRGFVFKRFLK